MNAKEAAAHTKAVRAARDRAITVANKKANEERTALVEAALPGQLKRARARITKAVKAGECSVTMGYVHGVAEALRTDGYRVHDYSGTTNMGDSAAPCMVDYHDMEVSW